MYVYSENKRNVAKQKNFYTKFTQKNILTRELKIFVYFIIVFISLTNISCNIWDNIFSNLSSPENTIPEEFCVELFDKKNEKLKLGEIWVSSSNNKMKFVLYNTIEEIDILKDINYGENTKSELFEKNELLNLFKNFTSLNFSGNNSLNIFNYNNSSKNNQLLSIIIDFNKDSSISFLSEDFCQIQKNKNLNRIGVKLILVSYDLFTYFEENFENENYSKKEKIVYDDYILTNLPINLKNDFLMSDRKIKILLPLFQAFISEKYKKEIDSLKNNFDSQKISTQKFQHLVDKKALIVFRVNKQTQKLQEINLKYDDVVYYSMATEVKTLDSINDTVFDPIELKEDGVICEIVKEGDKKEKSMAQFVIENFIKLKK